MKTRELAQVLRGTTPTTPSATHIHKSGSEDNAPFIFRRGKLKKFKNMNRETRLISQQHVQHAGKNV
jgi:hypothetical protein